KLTRRQPVNACRAADSCDQSHLSHFPVSHFPACVVKRQNTTSSGCTSYTPKLRSAWLVLTHNCQFFFSAAPPSLATSSMRVSNAEAPLPLTPKVLASGRSLAAYITSRPGLHIAQGRRVLARLSAAPR